MTKDQGHSLIPQLKRICGVYDYQLNFKGSVTGISYPPVGLLLTEADMSCLMEQYNKLSNGNEEDN